MLYILATLGFTVFTIASPIPKPLSHLVVIPLDRLASTDAVHRIESGRVLPVPASTLAAFRASTKAISISGPNSTAQSPTSSATPSQASFNLPQQPQWGPGDISNVLFGCVASVLGGITVGLPYYLYRQQLSRTSQHSGLCAIIYIPVFTSLTMISVDDSVELDDVPVFEPSDDDIALPLEDLPPAYTSENSSAGNIGHQGTGSPVTPTL